MRDLEILLEGNKKWAEDIKAEDPHFFEKLSELQEPMYLWIGCSDSRITPSSSLGLLPGELFVHRNVANLVVHTDINCLSVIQFAVEALKVKHVIVCGHYGCGGVKAALDGARYGLIDNWLRHIQDTMYSNESVLNAASDYEERLNILCRLNVIEQVINVGQTTFVRDAWARDHKVYVHGWIYSIADGIYRSLDATISSLDDREALRKKTNEARMEAAAR